MSSVQRKCAAALHLVRRPSGVVGLALPQILARPYLREALYRCVDWRDRRRIRQTGFSALPPATLRYRVHGDLDLNSFLQSGRHCSEDIRSALRRVGRSMESLRDVLDFGCGCGRTIIWLSETADSVRFSGTDIDVVAIEWCRRHLKFASFQANQPTPPLAYPAKSFDLVYAISVFTHLDQEHQLLWLSELQRVTRSNGLVVVSVHGAYYWSGLEPGQVQEVEHKGWLFLRAPAPMQGLFPEWYQNAYHTEKYVRSTFSQYFQVLEYIPKGLDDCQDLIVMQRP